jgi:hypothetical protein
VDEERGESKRSITYVYYVLNLPKYSGDGLADERNSRKQPGLANEDVEQGLVDADKLFLIVSYVRFRGNRL